MAIEISALLILKVFVSRKLYEIQKYATLIPLFGHLEVQS